MLSFFVFVFVLLFPFFGLGRLDFGQADWQGIQLVSRDFVWSNDNLVSILFSILYHGIVM